MYILLNFNNGKISLEEVLNEVNENKLLNEKKYLVYQNEDKNLFEKLNKEGYNVYKTLNTFSDNRRILSNLDKFQKILIDFDKNDFDSYIELIERVNKLKHKFDIAPTEILKTYKGYHYIYSLDKELEYLDIEQYTNFSNFIVNLLNGDKKAHQVTGIYKVPGYLDMKNNRNFLIEKETGASHDKLITAKVIEKIIGEKVKTRKDIIEKETKKRSDQKEMTVNYSQSINKLNFKDYIIPKLIEAGHQIKIDEYGKINDTNGITLSKDGFVNDFSHGKESGENRANGNYNFLLNYVFEGNYSEFMKFCSIYLGVKRVGNGKIEIPKEIVNVITKKELKMGNFVKELKFKEDELMIDSVSDMFIASEKLVLDNLKNFSSKLFSSNSDEEDINKIVYSNSIINTLLGVIGFSKNSKQVTSLGDSTYKFNIEDLLSFFKLDNHINNRQSLMMLLVSSSRLQFLRKYEGILDGEATKGYEVLYSPLQIMYFGLGENGKSHVVIKIIESNQGNHYLPKDFFNINQKVFNNKNNYNYLTLHISDLLEKKGLISFSFEKFVEMAGLKIKESNPRVTKGKIKDLLEKLKDLKIIKNYKFEKNGKIVILGKLYNN